MVKRIMEVVIFVLFVFIYSVALCFLQDVFTMCSGKPIAAVSIFMTGNSRKLLVLEVVVATVAFFVVVFCFDVSRRHVFFPYKSYI